MNIYADAVSVHRTVVKRKTIFIARIIIRRKREMKNKTEERKKKGDEDRSNEISQAITNEFSVPLKSHNALEIIPANERFIGNYDYTVSSQRKG